MSRKTLEEMRAEAAVARDERKQRLTGFELEVAEAWDGGSVVLYINLTPQWQRRLVAMARRLKEKWK